MLVKEKQKHGIFEGFIYVQKVMKQKGEEMILPREKMTKTAITFRSYLKKYAQEVFIT